MAGLALIPFFALLAAAPVRGAQETVTGTVADAGSEEPVRGGHVSVEGGEASVVTGRNGRFRLEGVETGSRELRVEALGYYSREVTVEVGPDGARLEIVLTERPLSPVRGNPREDDSVGSGPGGVGCLDPRAPGSHRFKHGLPRHHLRRAREAGGANR